MWRLSSCVLLLCVLPLSSWLGGSWVGEGWGGFQPSLAEASRAKKPRTADGLRCEQRWRPWMVKKRSRLALLIANTKGWRREATLHHAIEGDLERMCASLDKVGFVIPPQFTLRDPTPERIRQALKEISPFLKKHRNIKTFFLYYTGHADEHHLHTGAQQVDVKPISYEEIAQFFVKLDLRQRFILLDACLAYAIVKLLGKNKRMNVAQEQDGAIAKGVDKMLGEDLRKTFEEKRRRDSSHFHVIVASQEKAYESPKQQGSLFTHFFLEGLEGKADLNQDGKITMTELFDYAKPRVRREKIAQIPDQFVAAQGDLYAFAHIYPSSLQIPRGLTGQFKLAIGGLVWEIKKKHSEPLLLAVVKGSGFLLQETKKGCFVYPLEVKQKEHIDVPAAKEKWQRVPCQKLMKKKGGAPTTRQAAGTGVAKERLVAVATQEDDEDEVTGLMWFPPKPMDFTRDWSLEIQGGIFGTSGLFKADGGELLGSLSVGVRWRFLGLSLQSAVGSVSFLQANGQQAQFLQSLLLLRGEAGYRAQFGRFDLFLGGTLGVGALLHDLNARPLSSFAFQAGLTANLSLWLSQRWALSVTLEGGLHPAMIPESGNLATLRFFGLYSARLGFRYRFGVDRLFY